MRKLAGDISNRKPTLVLVLHCDDVRCSMVITGVSEWRGSDGRYYRIKNKKTKKQGIKNDSESGCEPENQLKLTAAYHNEVKSLDTLTAGCGACRVPAPESR